MSEPGKAASLLSGLEQGLKAAGANFSMTGVEEAEDSWVTINYLGGRLGGEPGAGPPWELWTGEGPALS